MVITRYEPAAVVSQLQSEINRMFGNLVDGESSSATAEWMPAVDIQEYLDRFELLVDLPGVNPSAVITRFACATGSVSIAVKSTSTKRSK